MTEAAGYELSRTNTVEGDWTDTLTETDETCSTTGHSWSSDWTVDANYHWHECTNDGCTLTDNSKKGSYGAHSDGDVDGLCDDCGYIMEIEITPPTGTITVKENAFTSFINTITFGIFGKDNFDVTIDASDKDSGVKSVEYLIYEVSDGDTGLSQSDLATENDWQTYSSSFSISSNGKYIIYAKITDNSGNVAYISSDGIVKYTDAAADTQSISFTKTSTAGVAASVTTNGNTINAITNGTATLGSDNYSVSYSADKSKATITFSASYLDSLTEGSYTLTITYNPQGETYVESTKNDAPVSTNMGLVVSRAGGSVTITNDLNKTYDGKVVSTPTYDSLSSGTATIKYKVKGAEDSTYSSTAPTDAAPTYTVAYSVFAGGEDASDLSGTLAFACVYDPEEDEYDNAGSSMVTQMYIPYLQRQAVRQVSAPMTSQVRRRTAIIELLLKTKAMRTPSHRGH